MLNNIDKNILVLIGIRVVIYITQKFTAFLMCWINYEDSLLNITSILVTTNVFMRYEFNKIPVRKIGYERMTMVIVNEFIVYNMIVNVTYFLSIGLVKKPRICI